MSFSFSFTGECISLGISIEHIVPTTFLACFLVGAIAKSPMLAGVCKRASLFALSLSLSGSPTALSLAPPRPRE